MNCKRAARLLILFGMVAIMGVAAVACISLPPIGGVDSLSDFTNIPRKVVTSSLPLAATWEFTAPLTINWAPIVERGTVLVRSEYGLQAIDGATGRKIWEHQSGRSGGDTFSIATDGNIVAVDGGKTLRVLDFASGQEIWHQEIVGSDRIRSLAMDDERVYAASTIAVSQAAAYDIRSGKLVWRQDKLVPRSMFGIHLSGDSLYVFSGGRFILDKHTGAITGQLGELAFNSRLSPVVSGQTLFIASLDGTLRAIDLLSLDPRWALTPECSTYRGDFEFPTIVSDIVYAASGCSEVYAVDMPTGRKLWTYRPSADLRASSSVAVLDGIGYVVYSDGSLRAIDLRSGEPVGVLQTEPAVVPGVVHGSGAAVGNGFVYAYFGGRELFAFKAAR